MKIFIKLFVGFIVFNILFLCLFTCGQTGVINKYKILTDSITFFSKYDTVFNSSSAYYPSDEWLIDYKETVSNYDFLTIRNLYIPELKEGFVFSIDYSINRKGQKVVGFCLREVIRKENGMLMHYQDDRISDEEVEKYDNLVKQKILNKLGFYYTGFDWDE